MLKNYVAFSFILLLSFTSLIFFKIRNIILLILIQAAIFSLIIYPTFCGLFQNKIHAYFNKHYLNCIYHGFFIFFSINLSGAILTTPFVIFYQIAPSNLKLLTPILSGIGATIWLFSLTKLAFAPLWPTEKLKNCIKLSKQTAKNNRINLFKIALKTYASSLILITIPWTIKRYVQTIQSIKLSNNQNLRKKKYIPLK